MYIIRRIKKDTGDTGIREDIKLLVSEIERVFPENERDEIRLHGFTKEEANLLCYELSKVYSDYDHIVLERRDI